MLPVGARPPTFPDEPDEPAQSDVPMSVPPGVERHLHRWTMSASTDTEGTRASSDQPPGW